MNRLFQLLNQFERLRLFQREIKRVGVPIVAARMLYGQAECFTDGVKCVAASIGFSVNRSISATSALARAALIGLPRAIALRVVSSIITIPL